MDAKTKKALYKAHEQYVERQTRPPEEKKIISILRQDPMSPYTNPQSQLVFESITEEINKRSFKAVYPQSYTPVSPYFTENNITPYFNPGEDIDYAHGAITIAGMIDLVSMNKPWALERVEDFDPIIDLASQYRDLLSKHNKSNSATQYLVKVNKFLTVMEKGRLRAYRRIGKIDVLRSKDIKYFLKDFIMEY